MRKFGCVSGFRVTQYKPIKEMILSKYDKYELSFMNEKNIL